MRILPLLLVVFAFLAMAAPPKTLVIQTNAKCGMCKTHIEGKLLELDGVQSAELDLETKAVTVKYKGGKVSADQLRQAISAAGYQADEVAPDAEALKGLSDCCKTEVKKSGACCAGSGSATCKKPGTK